MDKKVIEIPARELDIAETNKPLRVAAYCRVSTDKDEQQNSLEMQVKYYTEKYREHPTGNWPESLRMKESAGLPTKSVLSS